MLPNHWVGWKSEELGARGVGGKVFGGKTEKKRLGGGRVWFGRNEKLAARPEEYLLWRVEACTQKQGLRRVKKELFGHDEQAGDGKGMRKIGGWVGRETG